MTKKLITAFLLLLMAACASSPYERTIPEKRYQALENRKGGRRSSNGMWHVAPEKIWTQTFSVMAPDGEWTFWGPYSWGGIIFRGNPDGLVGKYVGHEVKMILETRDPEVIVRDKGWAEKLQTLKSKDFQGYVDAAMAENKELYARLAQEKDGHRPIPRKYSMRLATYRDLTCTLYEDEEHIPIGSYGGGKPSPGAEAYGIGFFCPGFLNGRIANFGYGVRIVVDNQHITDGVYIDPEIPKADVLKRLQRSLDSVEFNGDFTQAVPASYQ